MSSVALPRQDVSSSQGGSYNSPGCLLLEHWCSSVFHESNISSCRKYIPDLKVLAQNIVNANSRAEEVPLQCVTEQPETNISCVRTDCPNSETYCKAPLALCNSKSFRDASDLGEKLPRKHEFYKIMQKDMKDEKNRLETFKNIWPLSYIDPSDLAAVGFFYLQAGDKVQCAFCHGIIVDWAPGDDPLTEHSLHFPLCPFLMQRDVGNISISGKKSVIGQNSNSYPEKMGPFRRNNSSSATGSSVSRPKFPNMESKEKRLHTFHSWKYSEVKPDNLSEAGFFSTGTSDIVACFSCGGTLGHWDMGDDPWLEHKKHFPHCSYLKSVNHSTVRSYCNGYQCKESESASNNVSTLQLPSLDELMKSAVCVEAIKIFSEKLVREALDRQVNLKGQAFRSLEELCSTILEIQDEAEKNVKTGVESQVQKNGSATSSANNYHVCKICYDKEMGVVFLPCGHMMACPECAQSVTTCPLCRKVIEGSVRAYIS